MQRSITPLTVLALSAAVFGLACAQSEDIDLQGIANRRPATSGNGGSVSPTGLGGSNNSGSAGNTGSTGGTTDPAGTAGDTGSSGSGGSTGPGTAGAGSQGQAGNGSGGSTGAAGNVGAGGNVSGQGGSVGGSGGSSAGGTGGSFTGRGGTTGSGGAAGGRGGTGGSAGGRGGAGGSTGTGGSTSADGGTQETFTDVYNSALMPYCGGSNCHNPGSQRGVSVSSKTNAYNTLKSYVTAGNGAGSSLYTLVNSGAMPQGQAKLSAANIAKIKTWIDQGALNN